MIIRGKKLDDTKVAAAKARFEKVASWRLPTAKITLRFDELLDRFANDCMSFADIAGESCEKGVCRDRIRQLYNKYFRDLFPGKRTGIYRRKICVLKNLKVASKKAENDFLNDEDLAKVVQLAAEAGCTTKRKVSSSTRHGTKVSSRMLLVDGRSYSVHCLGVRERARGYRFSKSRVSKEFLRQADGAIILQKLDGLVDRVFVVPSREILDAYGSQKGMKISIFIPLEKSPVFKRRPCLLDWWKYENAWPPPPNVDRNSFE